MEKIQKIQHRQCRWREMSFVHQLLINVVNPQIDLFKCLENWDEIRQSMKESPRKKRSYQNDELRSGKFG